MSSLTRPAGRGDPEPFYEVQQQSLILAPTDPPRGQLVRRLQEPLERFTRELEQRRAETVAAGMHFDQIGERRQSLVAIR